MKTLRKDRKKGSGGSPPKCLLTIPFRLLESVGNTFHHIHQAKISWKMDFSDLISFLDKLIKGLL